MRDKIPNEMPAGNNPNVQSSDGGDQSFGSLDGHGGLGQYAGGRREQVSQNNPEASSPNAKGAGDVRHTSYPQNEAAQNPAAPGALAPHGYRTFRCADALGARLQLERDRRQ